MRPNLLLITSDQQHWSTLGVLNPKIQTPNLDRLAKMGTNFTRAYCPNPTCTPTRASILTGQYPSSHGAYTLGTKLPEHVPTLGDHLRDLGYRSTLVGKAHFQPLASTPECESVESYPTLRDLDFWRSFNDQHTPWYGFDHVELTRNHTDEGHAGQHYGAWLEDKGVTHWRQYFQVGNDGVNLSGTDGKLAPLIMDGPGYGWREDMAWKLPEEHHYTAWTGQRSIAAIESAVSEGVPFFVWASYHDPHPPYAVPEPWASMYDPDGMEVGEFVEGEFEHMPPPHQMTRDPNADFNPFNEDGFGNHGYHPHAGVSQDDLKKAQAIYYGMISFMDHWIGKTLDKLESLGVLHNTLVVFTSDHGHFLGQHGLVAKGPFHYEDVIRVPFLAAFGDRMSPGSTSTSLQSLVDLAPTFLEAAGLEQTPRAMQGESRLGAWCGDSPSASRKYAIVENHHNASDAVHLKTLVTQRHKLTVYRGRDWGELFDLAEDPEELDNRFGRAEYAAVEAELMSALVQADLDREPAPQARVSGA
ncbi:MAG: sulfatase-like hydrolase/transferase [Planctomycetota bacterium]